MEWYIIINMRLTACGVHENLVVPDLFRSNLQHPVPFLQTNSKEAATDDPKLGLKETPKEVAKENVQVVQEDTPVVIVKEDSKQAPQPSSKAVLKENSEEVPKTVLKEKPKIPESVPKENLVDTPNENAANSSEEFLGELSGFCV